MLAFGLTQPALTIRCEYNYNKVACSDQTAAASPGVLAREPLFILFLLRLLTGEPPFNFPVTAFFGTRDRRITEPMVLGWQRFTTGGFECLGIDGHHLWPLEKESKLVWLRLIAERLQKLA